MSSQKRTASSRQRNRRTRYPVQLNTSARKKKQQTPVGFYRMGAAFLVVLTLGCLLGVLYAGVSMAHKTLFSSNDRFVIREIEIQDGRVKTEPMIREYLDYVGIKPGENLFSFDIAELADEYLENNPLVNAVKVERRLPDKLSFAITERRPLARLGQRGTLVTDREGFVFRLRQDLHSLPVIIGNRNAELVPGSYVEGMTRAAIEVLEVCDNPRVGMQVLGVDVGRDDYLLLHVVTEDGIKEARLSWAGMGDNSTKSRDDLLLRLGRLRQVARQDRSGRSEYDATIPGRIYAR